MQENYRTFTAELHDCSNEELVELFQNTQKEKYLKELMVKNNGVIHIIASSYHIPAYDIDDLMSIGYEELWKVAKNYDKNRGYTFSTVLKGFIRQRYNRLYNEAYRGKRGGGSQSVSNNELEDINKERFSCDDYSNLYLTDFLKDLTDTTRDVAELLIRGFSKGNAAQSPAPVSPF